MAATHRFASLLALAMPISIGIGCGDDPSGPVPLLHVGGSYVLDAEFTRTYDCDPADTLPRDAELCGSDQGVVTVSDDTLALQFVLDAVGQLGEFDGGGTATLQQCELRASGRPAAGCRTISGEIDVDIMRTPIDCPETPADPAGEPGPDLCAGREGQAIVVLTMLLGHLDGPGFFVLLPTLFGREGPSDAGGEYVVPVLATPPGEDATRATVRIRWTMVRR